jgi:DNA-binding IclR family transcriptional regulator
VAPDLPDDVRTFLSLHVESLEHLAILLALIESDSRWWDARAMSGRVGIAPADARRALEGFASRNLLDIRITDDVHYRLRPGTTDLDAGVRALADAYRRSPPTVLRWAAGGSRRRLAELAAAFRIKKR